MVPIIYLYPNTSIRIKERIADLRRRHRGMSNASGNSRNTNQQKVATYEEICLLEQTIGSLRPIPRPIQNERGQRGHCITLAGRGDVYQQFHLCSGMDVRYHNEHEQKDANERLISVESPIGKALVGVTVGDTVKIGKQTLHVACIRVSEYV